MENRELAFFILIVSVAHFVGLYVVYKYFAEQIEKTREMIRKATGQLAERFYEEAGYIMDEIDRVCGDWEDEEDDAKEGTTFASTTGSPDIVTIKATNSDPNNWTVNNDE